MICLNQLYEDIINYPEPEIKFPYEKYGRKLKKLQYSSPKLSIEQILELYGLHKQISVGDCNILQPYTIQLIARAKYNAWIKCKGITYEDANIQFIQKANYYFKNVFQTNEKMIVI